MQAVVMHETGNPVEPGTHILENSTTAELAAGGHSEFLFCLTVQKTKGSTGAMASPVAIV